MSIQKLTGYFLGLNLNGIPKPIKVKINEIIDTVNGITDGGSSFDTITELTSDSGVTVDGLLIKDGGIVPTKGAVTQITNITTGVTMNTKAGIITTVSSTLAADTSATFTLTSSAIVAGGLVFATINTYAGTGNPVIEKVTPSALGGSATITIRNVSASAALNDIMTISIFTV